LRIEPDGTPLGFSDSGRFTASAFVCRKLRIRPITNKLSQTIAAPAMIRGMASDVSIPRPRKQNYEQGHLSRAIRLDNFALLSMDHPLGRQYRTMYRADSHL
jgi:hypothetical protein